MFCCLNVFQMLSRLLVLTLCVFLLYACGSDRPRENVLIADDADTDSIVVMDFTTPLSLDPVAPGWYHRQFKRHGPMDISFPVSYTHLTLPTIYSV